MKNSTHHCKRTESIRILSHGTHTVHILCAQEDTHDDSD